MGKTRQITIMAMFVAIGFVINWLSNVIPDTFGKISMVYTFCFLAGIYLGGWRGCIVAMLADGICCIIAPVGPWIPQITASNGLMALITGIVFKYSKKDFIWKLIISAVISLFVCSAGMTAWGLSMFYPFVPKITAKYLEAFGNSSYLVWALAQLIRQPLIIVMNVVITTVLYESLVNKVDITMCKPAKNHD